MPEIAYCILMALLEYPEASAHQVTAASGYQFDKYQRVAAHMILLGWMYKPWQGRWKITERGKVAVAIETGRRSKRTYNRRVSYTRGKLREFLEFQA